MNSPNSQNVSYLLFPWKTMLFVLICFLIVWQFISCTDLNSPKSKIPALKDQHKSWKDYGGGPDQSKYVKTDQINKSNVAQLQTTWFYPTGDNNMYQFNPIVVDSIMYVLAKDNSLVALNAITGEEIWIHANLRGIARRGINYWESEDRKDRRLIFQMNNYLQAIDAQTGKSITDFGKNGLVDLRVGLGRDPETLSRAQSGSPGKIFENLLLLGSSTGEGYNSSPGFLRAYNVITGELVWTFHTIPQPGEYGYDTWPKDAYKYVGGVNTWGEISVDEERGIAYYPLGSPTYDYYGADRIGSNLFGNCILALDARKGERKWHFQVVHHDLWDYDLTAAPQLITVSQEGKKIDAVAVATKHGFLFSFNRVTGEPLWPIEERLVPPSDVPGEEAWPTQPFPTKLPPVSRQTLTADDLSADLTPEELVVWDGFVTPEEREGWKKRLDTARSGLFIPLSDTHETVSMPGATGGTNWGNTAANPEKGIVYILSQSYASIYKKLETKEQIQARERKLALASEGAGLFVKNCQACHGPEGAGQLGPSIMNLSSRMSYSDFKNVVNTGRGEMPAFPQFEEEEIKDLFKFLEGSTRGLMPLDTGEYVMPEGPVVASGGIPGGQDKRIVTGTFDRFGPPYPENVDVPSVRYYVEGYGLGHPYIIPPPWSEIMAYDLNEGKLLWRVPLGKSKEGLNTGLPRGSQRNGMIVTSTGLVFSTAGDGNIYAFDAENGKELWSQKLPMHTEGLPSMYEINGRIYLVVTATSKPSYWGLQSKNKKEMEEKELKGGYVVFSLPKDKNSASLNGKKKQ
ncbi:hypothetical protein BH23BAC1_BH23BAC1_37960 [soil metagenome]